MTKDEELARSIVGFKRELESSMLTTSKEEKWIASVVAIVLAVFVAVPIYLVFDEHQVKQGVVVDLRSSRSGYLYLVVHDSDTGKTRNVHVDGFTWRSARQGQKWTEAGGLQQ